MKRMLCVTISIIMLCSVCGAFLTSAASDYTIVSPYADVTQLVECLPSKQIVARSSRVVRSIKKSYIK